MILLTAIDAAQHHWIGSGWLWVLRFADGTTSVGLVQPCGNWSETLSDDPNRLVAFQQFIRHLSNHLQPNEQCVDRSAEGHSR